MVQLIRVELERIVRDEHFQSSRRSCDLLRYVVENALQGAFDRLKERCIGVELFGRDPDYLTSEDAIVRVAANDVRKRLGEYYRVNGARPVRVTLPTGVYVPELEVNAATPEAEPAAAQESPAPATEPPRRRWRIVALAAGVGLLLGAAAGWLGRGSLKPGAAVAPAAMAEPAWPWSRILDDRQRTLLVLADSNLGILGVMRGRRIGLQEYLRPGFFQDEAAGKRYPELAQVMTNSMLTSYADAAIVAKVLKAAGRHAERVQVRSARDIRMRDLQEGNIILLGSPSSNPWVSLFSDRLNFEESVALPDRKVFLNKQRREGEQAEYKGFAWTGSAGEEYAAVALLPNENRKGNVLILQGLHQEGTEAAGALLASDDGRKKLAAALGQGEPAAFEALLRSRAVAGSSSATEVVAVRKPAALR